MKRFMVIYNPSSGKEIAQQKVFQTAKNILSSEEIVISFFSTKKKNDAFNAAKSACKNMYDTIIACGGDGTINEVVNGIMVSGKKAKLAILPSGTVNDFASHMKIPASISAFTNMLIEGKTKKVDVGKANNKYFINVVSGGAFTNIPHEVPSEIKSIFGKFSYYAQAAIEIPEQISKSYRLKICTPEKTMEIESLVFIVSNSPSIGGFKNFSPLARCDDGLLDIIVIEKCHPLVCLEIFTSISFGDHINNPYVHYLRSSKIEIVSEDDLTVDIDGEYGFKLPVKIENINQGLEIIIP